MAEALGKESTLQAVLDQLKVANDLSVGMKVDLTHMGTEIKKTRSDAGKTHNWAKKENKGEDKEQKKQTEKLGFMASLLLAGKKLQERAAKTAKVGMGKASAWGKKQIESVKKAAGSLMDLLKKGLGLAALWLLFKAIQMINWEGLTSAAKKVGEAIVGIIDFLGTLAIRVGAWLGFDRIRQFFGGKEGKLAAKIRKLILSIRIGMLRFTGKGSFLGKLGDLFKSFMGFFGKIPGIKGILKFVKGAAKFLGKIFVPVTVLMALWEAVTGFMDGFSATEGNMAQKIIGGIGGAVKSLLDFFIFGIADMIQSAIVWLLELFGFDSAAVAVGDFNLVGKIKDSVFAVIDFVVELFQFKDTSLAGIFKSLVDIIMLPLNMAINFVKNLFGWGDPNEPFKFSEFVIETWNTVVAWVKDLFAWGAAAGETEDGGWSLMKFVNEVWAKVKGWITGLLSWASDEDEGDSFVVKYVKKAINGVKAWFGKMFDFGSAEGILKSVINVMTWLPNIIKDAIAAVTEWLLGLFGFDDAAKAVADANKFSIGDMVMNAIKGVVEWLEKLFDIDIGAILSNVMGALGDAGKKVLGWLGFGDDKPEKKAMGGPVGKGEPVLVGEHGPELFVPSASGKILPKMQTESAMGGGGAPMIINAPTTSNVSNGTQTVSIASSSINPMNDKYFRN